MGYIIKDTAALVTTKLTDAARKKLSEGTFNITYFQVGDSEVCYDCIQGDDLSTWNVLESEYNAQNLSPLPEKNKGNIKYPLRVDNISTNTFGIPVRVPYIDPIYNTAAPRGFFTGTTIGQSGDFIPFTTSAYTLNPNYVVDISTLNGTNNTILTASVIEPTVNGQVNEGDFATIYFTNGYELGQPYPILTYKVIEINGDTSTNSGTVTITIDRDLPNFQSMGYQGNGRVLFYPSGMTELYDTYTPEYYWEEDAINFETGCDISQTDVKIWNMNIPWTESPAGVFSNTIQDYTTYESRKYIGTKEYLGYHSDSGQTDTSGTYYYNSFSEKIYVKPSDQKSVAIVHYTNQAIDNFYGEKFALQPYDSLNPGETGQARNFKIEIPWLMWHKSQDTNIGETFYVDPPGYDNLNLFDYQFISSIPDETMNDPGLRYYNLWDTNTNYNGFPNRVGKVWPDLKLITFDDDEIIAAMSYKSNRNWTLPAPKLGLIVPNTFNNNNGAETGVLSGETEVMWVTYRFNSDNFTESLHCNYYSKIQGNSPDCPPETTDITVRFGNEFPYMFNNNQTNSTSGFSANEIVLLTQRVLIGEKPNPTQWREINVEPQIQETKINGFLTVSGLTGTTFIINRDDYNNAPLYDLSDYIDLPTLGDTGTTLNFGGEYFFYGNIETDIQATIYVMNYLCNLGQNQFLTSTNPTWDDSYSPYVTEVSLYDNDKNLMIISKIQSPELRQGVQQYSIKLDF